MNRTDARFISNHLRIRGSWPQFSRARDWRLPMNLKTVPLITKGLRVLRFRGAMRVFGRGDLILVGGGQIPVAASRESHMPQSGP